MVAVPSLTIPWADGDHSFRLAIADWQELYRKVFKLFVRLGVSEAAAMAASTPMAIHTRIANGDPVAGEVGELIFQALVGAGMDGQAALALRKRYVDDKPMLSSLPTAHAIVLHALMGPPEPEEPKKAAAEEVPSSPSADSTATAQRSASRRNKSTK